MHDLLLLRHAKSSWQDLSLADHQRPLNKRGKQAAPRMASYLLQHAPHPSHVFCSTSQRTRDTLALCLDTGWPKGVSVSYHDDIYEASAADLMTFLEQYRNQAGNCPLLIGHNPGFTDLINILTDDSTHIDNLPTAGAAWLQAAHWPPLAGDCVLQSITTPKQLAPR